MYTDPHYYNCCMKSSCALLFYKVNSNLENFGPMRGQDRRELNNHMSDVNRIRGFMMVIFRQL